MPSSTTPLTARSSALATYTAAHELDADPLTSAQWNAIAADLIAADAGRNEPYVIDRATDARASATTQALRERDAATTRHLIPVLQLAETYAVVGPMATSLHAGFLEVERAFDCAARLTAHTKREHIVKAVPTAPQRKQPDTTGRELTLIPVLYGVEVVA